MKQIVQNYRTGELAIRDVPDPVLRRGGVLVRTAFSLISAGTEKNTIRTAQSSLLGKARGRPDLVRQVFDTFKREGFRATYEKVTARLNQVKGLGYSSAGTVIEVGANAPEFRVGDRVACAGGGYASHAEVNYVPRNLCVKVPQNVSLDVACYTTLGAIALQGIRQSAAVLGEAVAVIGLGLVGQLTVQLLKASGCTVLGIDIDPRACELARKSGADATTIVQDAGSTCDSLTGGRGADKIIVTASSRSSDPLVLAAELARDRATIVVVGLVGMDVPRSLFYEKELELKLSRSYGPGRYDSQYEEKGADYPIGYVRWTENRNMAAFLQLASERKIDPALLTSHRFGVERAKDAYDLILAGSERCCGVLLEYPDSERPRAAGIHPVPKAKLPAGKIGASFIGAGNFGRGVLLPILKRHPKVKLLGVAAGSGISAQNTAAQFGFEYAAAGVREIVDDPRTDVLFIATRHDSHAELASEALRAGKSVFVEKPLAIDESGLREIIAAHKQAGGLLMAGFNRRFSPVAIDLKSRLAALARPMTISYRINAGRLPPEHWTLNPEEGGGRIIGEVCHFVDFVQFLTGALPVHACAERAARSVASEGVDDSAVLMLSMSDGSVSSIVYAAAGDASIPKERIEVFCGGAYGLIDDFRDGRFVRNGSAEKLGGAIQDKGHAGEIDAFVQAIAEGGAGPIPFESMIATTLACLAAVGAHRPDIDVQAFLSKT